MDKRVYERFNSDQVTEEMLEEASKLFTENYGIWSESASKLMGKFAKAGGRVRLSKERLRKDYLTHGITSYVRVTVNDQLAGNAFACRWTVDSKTICWITQLVVHSDYRERGLASGLLNQVMQDGDDVFGVMSSHPAACLATAKTFSSSINTVSLEYMRENAEQIMQASPVRYVQDAKLRGKLFQSTDDSGLVCSVDTGFHVDHEEPLEALVWVQDMMEWPLGELIDGHEFILIVEAKRRSRSRSRSAGRKEGS